MILSRVAVAAMDEADLRTKVLIPLFRAMGFLDVFHFHGGVLEQGKDIVMWQRDRVRDRINFGVVVKASKVTGRASGSSSAGEVATQVQQCLGGRYRDQGTLIERSIDRCLVVSSHEIAKEAVASIGSILPSDYSARIDFVDGDKLWAWIMEYLPPTAALTKLEEARQVFEKASKHHRIVPIFDANGIALSTQPKHDKAYQEEPIVFEAQFAFPESVEGKAALSELQRHVATGAPVKIPHAFIQQFDVPEFLRPFMLAEGQPFEITLGPRRFAKPLIAHVTIAPDSHPAVTLANLQFQIVQIGTDEVTLDNASERVPWHLRVRINLKDQRLHLEYNANPFGANVSQELTTVRLIGAMALGGLLTITNSETGLIVVSGRIPPSTIAAPGSDYTAFLEALVFIQEATRTPITMPGADIAGPEVENAFEVEYILRNGRVMGTSQELRATLTRAGVERLLAELETKPDHTITVSHRESRTVLGSEVQLGTVLNVITGMTVRPDARQELRRALDEELDVEEFEVVFEPIGDKASVVTSYVDWLPVPEADRMRQGLRQASADAPNSAPGLES
jgi:hypothetical protein